jgi:SHS2 domain-containing protein
MPYRVLDHTADVGIEATADTFPALVAALAAGMFSFIADIEPCPRDRSLSVSVEADSLEDLVVDVLSELLYASEANDVIFCGFEVSRPSDTRLDVEVWGPDAATVTLSGAPVKAVTYHDVEVRSDDDGWYGRVYLDV